MTETALMVGTEVPAGMRGRVTATFERALHVRGEDDTLVMVLAEGVGASPQGVVLPARLPEVEVGARALVADGRLSLEIADGTARRWGLDDAPRYEGSVRRSADEPPGSPDAVNHAVAAVRDALASTGFGYFPAGPPHPPDTGAPSGIAAQARAVVSKQVDTLASAEILGDGDASHAAVARLVGLGPGLTPSGDDALVGFLAARWALCGDGGITARDAPTLLARTTDVSASYLALACEGRFAEPLASLSRAVACGDATAAAALAHSCLHTGATSGADALVGFLGGYASVNGFQPSNVGV